MSYDSWKTTPPDDGGYCPSCLCLLENVIEIEEDGEKRLKCLNCDEEFHEAQILDFSEANIESKERAKEMRADEERDERW